MPYGLKGSYSVGGGKTKHVGSGSMKRPTTTTVPRSSYQAPSKIKPSSGVAQSKTTPIKGTPKVHTTTTTSRKSTTTTTKKKGIGQAMQEKVQGAAQSRQSMLDEIMKGL